MTLTTLLRKPKYNTWAIHESGKREKKSQHTVVVAFSRAAWNLAASQHVREDVNGKINETSFWICLTRDSPDSRDGMNNWCIDDAHVNS